MGAAEIESHTQSTDPTLANVFVCVVGLAVLLAADWCANLASLPAIEPYETIGSNVFRFAAALGCIICAIPLRSQPPHRVPITAPALAIGLLVGHCAFVYASLLPWSGFFKVAGGALSGVLTGVLLVYWLACFCRFEARWAAVALPSAYVITSFVYFVLEALGQTVSTVAVATMPFASALAIVFVRRTAELDGFVAHRIQRSPQDWSFPTRPVVLMAAFKFAFFFSLALSRGATMHGPLGMLAIGAVTATTALVLYERFNPNTLYKVSLPCMVCGLLLLAWVDLGDNAATTLSNAGNIAFELFITMTLLDGCRRFDVDRIRLFGIVQGVSYCVSALGISSGRMFTAVHPAGATESNIAILALVVGLVTLSAFFFDERMALREFERTAQEPDKDNGTAPGTLAGIALQCAVAARAFDLSRREEQVLELLVQGLSVAQIEAELTISRSTVKSHIQHIYEKLGVHSRDEMLACVRGNAM